MKALKQYKAKRHFDETPEPKPKKASKKGSSKGLTFTIQKHAASHLHYDLRLEVDGVLKSWAVPKGPSLNPSEKRLAMMVEDHPMEYYNFEGIIPEGNYGAGTVMVWDIGEYSVPGTDTSKEAEQQMRDGLKKGHVDFTLFGKKLKGDFALVKMKNTDNQWLLFKKRDSYATDDPVSEKNRSVLTNRTMEEIRDNKKKKSPLTAIRSMRS